jgi:hypothetical protein
MYKGSIAIAEIEVTHNNMNWNEFDFFDYKLKFFTKDKNADIKAGWYAYILKDGIYYFRWCVNGYKLPVEYLKALKKDGYTLAYEYDFKEE